MERYLADNVCRNYPGHTPITVRLFPSIRGNTHCDCNPWSDRVLDCPVSNPIQVTCPFIGVIPAVRFGTIQAADTTARTVTITSPTSNPTYSASSTPLTIGGTASDNVAVTRVTWRNDRGGSGTCSGTTNWNCTGITLINGTNNITVTAEDAAGNSATDSVAVTLSGGP